jgi:hypothetical protein
MVNLGKQTALIIETGTSHPYKEEGEDVQVQEVHLHAPDRVLPNRSKSAKNIRNQA